VIFRRLSIRARLTVAFVASLALVLALAGLFVYLRTSSELTGVLEDGLDARAADLTAVVESGADPARLSGGLFEGEEGFSQILTADGEVIASTLAPTAGAAIDAQTLDRAAGGRVLVELEVPGVEGEAAVLAQPVSSAGEPVIVVAGSSTDDRREALAGIAGAFLIGAPLALVLAGGLGFLLATRALAPVEALRRRAAGITLDHSGERLPLPAAEDELHRLAETLNAMLDRIEGSLERERVFVADASHELRTPLAILRAELDLAHRPERTPEELREAIHSASEEVDRLSRLAEDLLVIARADQGRLPIKREPAEVRDLLERVGSRFASRARDAGRTVTVDAPVDLIGELDVLRVEQALGNLLDNALRHGRGDVRLAARSEDGSLLIEVADDGPGFAEGFEAVAFERFTRGEEGRTGGGAGLGLAIVEAIARAHGGRVTVVRAGAPATLRIALPRSGPTP
jgi:two-component system OmpR family sensor kinase